MSEYGKAPVRIGRFNFDLPEVMYYLYLPVRMDFSRVALPPNVECCRTIIVEALASTIWRTTPTTIYWITIGRCILATRSATIRTVRSSTMSTGGTDESSGTARRDVR
jgi:hypothetical protein